MHLVITPCYQLAKFVAFVLMQISENYEILFRNGPYS